MPHKANPDHYRELNFVITMAEASRRYGIPRQTLTYAIDTANLAAIRCGRTVLISVRSLEIYNSSMRT